MRGGDFPHSGKSCAFRPPVKLKHSIRFAGGRERAAELRSAPPRTWSYRTGLIVSEKSKILLDCGISFNKIRRLIGFSHIDGVLISHRHTDHSKAASDFLKNGVDVYVNEDTAGSLQLHGHRLRVIYDRQPFEVVEFHISPHEVKHDVPNLAFKISAKSENLLYVTDTPHFDFIYKKLNYVMCECNYNIETLRKNIAENLVLESHARRVAQSRMALETLVKIFENKDRELNSLKQFYLPHLSDDNSDERKIIENVKKLTNAEVIIAN